MIISINYIIIPLDIYFVLRNRLIISIKLTYHYLFIYLFIYLFYYLFIYLFYYLFNQSKKKTLKTKIN